VKSIRLLVTARDPASANDIVTVFLPMLKDKRFVVRVLAQNPAYGIFLKKLTPFDARVSQLTEFKSCIKFGGIDNSIVIDTFNEFHPDCILTGISGPDDYGVDEIALSISKRYKNIKTFSIQSYWGDINISLGSLADVIFVMDEFAKDATLLRSDRCDIVITGPLQSKRFNEINIDQERAVFRDEYNVDNVPIVGLFGQPLFEYKWYKSTMTLFIETLKQIDMPMMVAYKPHPKEDKASTQWIMNVMAKSGLNFFVINDKEALKILTGTDIAVSVFSTIGYDLQNLLLRSKVAFSIPFYLFFDDKCREWFREYCLLEEIPMSKYGAIVINNKDNLAKSIQSAFLDTKKELSHSMVLEGMPNNSGSEQYDIVSSSIVKFYNTRKEK
jgi:hypothetical protein